MKEIYTIMTATLGEPPSPEDKFSWDYYTEDGKAGHWEGTPVEFYKAFSGKYSVSTWCHIEPRPPAYYSTLVS